MERIALVRREPMMEGTEIEGRDGEEKISRGDFYFMFEEE